MKSHNWQLVELGKEIDLLTGNPFKSSQYSESPDDVALLRGDNIAQGYLRWDGVKRWSIKDLEDLENYFLQEHDVVLAMDRPWIESGLKYAYLSNRDLPCLLVQRVSRLRANKQLNQIFLRYVIGGRDFTKYILGTQTGTAIPHISSSQIKDFRFLLPSLDEQKQIADVLSCLDAKIENLRRQNETLEQIAQTLFKHWFIDFEFPNADGKPYKSSGGAMFVSELGDIPEGWRVGKFEDFIEKIIDNRGKTPPMEEDGVLMMEGNQIYCEHSFPQYAGKAKQKFVSEKTYKNWFRAGHPQYLDILCATVGTLPKWCFMPSNQILCIAQNIIGIRANKKVCSPYWLRLSMNTRYFIKSMLGRLLTTAQPSIKVGHMTSIEVIIPNIEIISLFSMFVSSLFIKIEVNQQQIQTLIKIRDSLLPKLMSGQIRVKE